jgi:HEAT repeat protein
MTPSISDLIVLLYAEQKEIRKEAVQALAARGMEAIPALTRVLADPDWVVRYRAVEALGMIPDPAVDPLLLTALRDSRDHVRYMGAKMLGIRKVKESAVQLAERLTDENEFVRRAAAAALGAIGDRGVRKALEAALSKESSIRVRGELEASLRLL